MKKIIMPLAVLIASTFGLSSPVYAAADQTNGVPVWNGQNPAPITICLNSKFDSYSIISLDQYYRNPQQMGELRFAPDSLQSMAVKLPIGVTTSFNDSILAQSGLLKFSPKHLPNNPVNSVDVEQEKVRLPGSISAGTYQLIIHAQNLKGVSASGPTITYNVISQCNK